MAGPTAVEACSVQLVELVKLTQLVPPYAEPVVDTPSRLLPAPAYKALLKLAVVGLLAFLLFVQVTRPELLQGFVPVLIELLDVSPAILRLLRTEKIQLFLPRGRLLFLVLGIEEFMEGFASEAQWLGLVDPARSFPPHFAAGAGVGFHAAARRFASAICSVVIFLAMLSRSFVAA